MKRVPEKVRKKARNIKLLLLDVDGVLTDGRIVLNDQGEEIKGFDVRDGQGVRLFIRAGLQIGIITGRFSRAVEYRAKDLGIRFVYQKVGNKLSVYEKLKQRTGVTDGEVAYVGDDIIDLPVLRRAGLAVTVKDGWEGLKDKVDYVTIQEGGRGAVREVIELLLRAQGKWEKVAREYLEDSRLD